MFNGNHSNIQYMKFGLVLNCKLIAEVKDINKSETSKMIEIYNI